MSGSVVIVESPAKAKTINKYLGPGYQVLASFGHIRDLPPKDGSVRPDEDFAMEWEDGERSYRPVSEITKAVKTADRVYLATDPDREGEAISWHGKQVLAEKRLINKIPVERITFNEITKSAVQHAIANPRALDQDLVDAYLARRALDYLVGFTLSPVLWRKLPGARSAGRVQSVALRLICEREAEIEAFRPREYWSVSIVLANPQGQEFTARLTSLDGKKLDKFDLANGEMANAAAARIRAAAFSVGSVERKTVRRQPYAPFITSTLQMEASRKLGFNAMRTMRLAQKLYEGVDIGGETVGLITYMRTDGVTLSGEAIGAARALIGQSFGDAYLPATPRAYKSKVKNAQEAHEAIRPTDIFRKPESLRNALSEEEYRLYDLIWRRTVACQMEAAAYDQVGVDIPSAKRDLGLRAVGSILKFDGFLRVYQEEERDDPTDDDEASARLPPLETGDALKQSDVKPEQHFTQPPPRYSEASLVKRLEELGIGRPSTYASIIQVLQDRDYVKLDKKRFVPEDRGRLVTTFLSRYFDRYVAYDFTADLEERLDDISEGKIDWKAVLRKFWQDFSAAVDETKELGIGDVRQALDEALGPHFFPQVPGGPDPRLCPSCGAGRLGLKLGGRGAFLGCSNYPACAYTRSLSVSGAEGEGEAMEGTPRELGSDPDSGLPVALKRGPYGWYIQLGPLPVVEPEAPAEGKKKKRKTVDESIKRASLPKQLSPGAITLESGLALLALPRSIGKHPSDDVEVQAGVGKFGAYLKHGSRYVNIPNDDTVLTIGLNHAVSLLAEAPASKKAPAAPAQTLGNHPSDGKPVTMGKGRFGPYVRHGSVFASLPRGKEMTDMTLEEALVLIAAKAGKAPKPAKAKAEPAEKPAKKAAAAKKPAAKKPAAKAAAKPKAETAVKPKTTKAKKAAE